MTSPRYIVRRRSGSPIRAVAVASSDLGTHLLRVESVTVDFEDVPVELAERACRPVDGPRRIRHVPLRDVIDVEELEP